MSDDRVRVGDHVTIAKRGKKGIWTAEFHHGNRHCRRSLKTRNKKVAVEEAEKLDASLTAGTFRRGPGPTRIAGAIDKFVEAKKLEEVRAKTLQKYETELRNLATFAESRGITNLQRLDAWVLDDYRSYRRDHLEAYTAYNHVTILKSFLKWCVKRGLIEANPLDSVALRKPERTPAATPTLPQVWEIINHADDELAAQLATLAFTGMRAGELQRLTPRSVDLENNWIHLQGLKTGVWRQVPIHRCLRPYLARQPRRTRAYFFAPAPSATYPEGDNFVKAKKLNERFQRVAKRLGHPVGRKSGGLVVHSLRHFFRSFCTNSGVPERAVDVWMGHVGQRSMAQVYYHLSSEESQRLMQSVPFDG